MYCYLSIIISHFLKHIKQFDTNHQINQHDLQAKEFQLNNLNIDKNQIHPYYIHNPYLNVQFIKHFLIYIFQIAYHVKEYQSMINLGMLYIQANLFQADKHYYVLLSYIQYASQQRYNQYDIPVLKQEEIIKQLQQQHQLQIHQLTIILERYVIK